MCLCTRSYSKSAAARGIGSTRLKRVHWHRPSRAYAVLVGSLVSFSKLKGCIWETAFRRPCKIEKEENQVIACALFLDIQSGMVKTLLLESSFYFHTAKI
jgi:hypothetical protein